MEFEGAKVIITGAASGIGAALSRRLVAEGASVALLDRDGPGAAALADELGAAALAITVDVRNAEGVAAAVDAAAGQMGGLTVLVNNAGVGMAKPLHTYSDKEFALIVGVNLMGTFHTMRAAIPIMLAAGQGVIVNNASLTGVRPTQGEGPYSAAKAAVINLSQTAALEYAPVIRVNSVAPGLIHTPLTELVVSTPEFRAAAEAGTPLGRVGRAEEVVEAILFLASGRSSYITGQNLVIDGGSILPSLQSDALLRKVSERFGTPGA